MTNYETEKGRIRGALSQEIECAESPYGQGKTLHCSSPGNSLTVDMAAVDAGDTWITFKAVFGGYAEATMFQGDFRKLMDAYGFDESDQAKCVADGSFREIASSHRTVCNAGNNVVQIEIYQNKDRAV